MNMLPLSFREVVLNTSKMIEKIKNHIWSTTPAIAENIKQLQDKINELIDEINELKAREEVVNYFHQYPKEIERLGSSNLSK